MQFDHKKFFENFKPWYRGATGLSLDATKVQDLDFILTQIESYPQWQTVEQAAYLLATIHVETFWPESGSRYAPIKEGGTKAYFIKRYWTNTKIRAELGNKSQYDAYARSGRGYVQSTGLKNDIRSDKEIRSNLPQVITEFEATTGQKFDLIAHPEQMLNPYISFAALTLAMFGGWYTGKKITTYISGKVKDYKNSRRVINGVDRAVEIAGYAEGLEDVLRNSLNTGENTTIEDVVNSAAKDQVATNLESGDTQVVTKEKASLKTRIITGVGAALTAIGGTGFSVATFLQQKLETITINQVAILALLITAGAIFVFFWDRASERAHDITKTKMQLAGDQNKNNVELVSKS